MDTNIAEYTYDALGRRIERVDAVAGVTTCFYYDDQRVILESETRPEGLEQRVFVYGNYIDETLVMRRLIPGGSWVDFFYGHDHLHSPVALFSPAGTVLERYEYDAYGTVHVMDAAYNDRGTSLVRSPVAFTGRTLDHLDGGSLQIMYYRARYYDPETGRFMQRDPLGIDPGGFNQNPFYTHKQYDDGTNIYVYVKNQPANNQDPRGLYVWPPSDPSDIAPIGKIRIQSSCIWKELPDKQYSFFEEYGICLYDTVEIPVPIGPGGTIPLPLPGMRHPLSSDHWNTPTNKTRHIPAPRCDCDWTVEKILQLWCCGRPTDKHKYEFDGYETTKGKLEGAPGSFSCKCKNPKGDPRGQLNLERK